MNRYILILIILISCILLTGCWSYREIDSIYIVAGIAIDKVPDTDQYNITAELINVMENKVEKNFESVLLETKGDTIFDAATRMVRISAKRLYWAHATSIIISDEVAREGIMPFLDLIARNEEGRLSANIYISKEKSAKKVLESKSFSTDIRSYELGIMVNESKHLVKVPALKIYEVINELSIPKTHVVLPTVLSFNNNGIDTNLLSGGAVFAEGKLVGFLQEDDIVPYLFIKDQMGSGILNVKTKENNPQNTIILEIYESNTKIKPIYGAENIGFDIKIKTEVSIGELTTMTDYISLEGRERLKVLAEESVKNQIEKLIKDVQKEFGFDIFGFGNIIRQRNPKLWKIIEKDWDTIFMDADFNIVCDIQIRNSGYFLKPIQVVN